MTSEVIQQIDSLLHLDEIGALSPHGIGGLARELLEKCKIELNSRAVPDVPELVTVAWELYDDKHNPDDKLTYKEPIMPRNGDKRLVRYDQAAAIIAAKDVEIERLVAINKELCKSHGILNVTGAMIQERAEDAEAKLKVRDKEIGRLKETLQEIANSYTAHGYNDAVDAVVNLQYIAKDCLNAKR